MSLFEELKEETLFDKMAEDAKTEILRELKGVKRKGMNKLIKALTEGELSNYWLAPASASYHLNVDKGLCIHSHLVMKKGLELRESLGLIGTPQEVPRESVVIATLLHDLAKACWNGENEYIPNVLKSGKVSEAKPFETNKKIPKIDHSIRSALMLGKYIDLTDAELTAIIYHDGAYTQHFRTYQNNIEPLWLIMHTADIYNARFIEPLLKG